MKALSVKHPWCELIATGKKTIEIRSWKTDYRGPLLIVSSLKPTWELSGKAVCIVDLVKIRKIRETDADASCCTEAYIDDYAWILENARPCEHIPVKGRLMLYETDMEDVSC